MIKVIDGKRYNSETAECVFQYTNGQYSNDFRYRSKCLFLTPKKAWFILHYGGPMSDMATSAGGGSIGWGQDIEPVSDSDAFGFLQAHSDDPDAQAAINKYFSDRVTDA